MIKTISLLLSAFLFLPGCTVYQSIGDSFGSYVSEPDGQAFKPVGYRWDYEHTALMYVYRPASEWSMDELESPSFNVDDERLFNVKGGGYTWYELEPGSYNIAMRRGLLGLEGIKNVFVLKEIARLELQAQAGKIYYLRYSEIDPPVLQSQGQSGVTPLGDGPLQLVDPGLALNELPVTKMIHHGRGRLQPQADNTSASASVDASAEQMQTGGQGTEAPAGIDSTKDKGWWPF
ncbi:MAG: hypothetical protein CMI08_09815 [Oceanospirillaceae bacterium]|uniref:DUF2846 domain-containing protein n=1 Tax=unclassified Thalassolituus TaxID=2624967 RepID=UPI000C5F5200|nr:MULTISPECIES: DUF2846 domain-containing protein [unclassified Thalassolituus]MAS24569.1 hypothetical protein [Oceanospirillaceae bacterium]MAX99480.1 hypothetical protein [Oceanospirillaceae bacterium]MBL33756.1 hypothetical protein [Oceanospirillaceae bacterium]MBS53504.1 hypothetical protein [Oceanospirillaceae bacterium]|tara:strand:+ start:4432 stop:5130 length:699 start_codon:yes stop_codon:yes gene_type:complete